MKDAPVQRRLATALADRYGIERELGQGGMATVFFAHDLKHQRDVAIKVLHPDLGAALGGERFLSEIRTTARLQPPHILPLLDSGEAESPDGKSTLMTQPVGGATDEIVVIYRWAAEMQARTPVANP